MSASIATPGTTANTREPKRLATPDDYDNEALYEEMSSCFYVKSLFVFLIRSYRWHINIQVVDEKSPLKSKEMARNRVMLLEQLGKGEFGRYCKYSWKLKITIKHISQSDERFGIWYC